MQEVIVIEDSSDLRVLLAEALRDEGYAVRAFGDGRTALGAVPTLGPRTCVILDLMLPIVTGYEVLDAIRALPFRVPVVVVSADPHASRADADAFLEKPFELLALLSSIEKLVGPRAGVA